MDVENRTTATKQEGFLFVSDPAPNVNDTGRFVDEYMQLKKDGHTKF